MERNQLVPAVLESRTKPKNTSARKVEEASADSPLALINDPRDLYDFVGLRLVFLLRNEVTKAERVICDTFPLALRVIKGEELKPNEFGYRAIHLRLRIPKEWLNDPVYTDFGRLIFEIQLRTLSEHNYAVASRVLHPGRPRPYRCRFNVHYLGWLRFWSSWISRLSECSKKSGFTRPKQRKV